MSNLTDPPRELSATEALKFLEECRPRPQAPAEPEADPRDAMTRSTQWPSRRSVLMTTGLTVAAYGGLGLAVKGVQWALSDPEAERVTAELQAFAEERFRGVTDVESLWRVIDAFVGEIEDLDIRGGMRPADYMVRLAQLNVLVGAVEGFFDEGMEDRAAAVNQDELKENLRESVAGIVAGGDTGIAPRQARGVLMRSVEEVRKRFKLRRNVWLEPGGLKPQLG